MRGGSRLASLYERDAVTLPLAIAKAAIALSLGGAAAGGVAVGGQAGQEVHQAALAASTRTYTVQPGDTLFRIAARFCGNGFKYPALARASGIRNPNSIYPGQHIVLACSGGGGSQSGLAFVNGSSVAANGQANIPGTVPSVYSYYGLEVLWLNAGGARWAASTAACIAERESGGRTFATGSAGERGLWQIAPGWGWLSSYNPYTNAHAAVVISHDGTNWGPWTTRFGCGVR